MWMGAHAELHGSTFEVGLQLSALRPARRPSTRPRCIWLAAAVHGQFLGLRGFGRWTSYRFQWTGALRSRNPHWAAAWPAGRVLGLVGEAGQGTHADCPLISRASSSQAAAHERRRRGFSARPGGDPAMTGSLLVRHQTANVPAHHGETPPELCFHAALRACVRANSFAVTPTGWLALQTGIGSLESAQPQAFTAVSPTRGSLSPVSRQTTLGRPDICPIR